MRIAYLAAGAAGMLCGSCLRDNRVASTLRKQGHDVLLLPLYTPLRTDENDASADAPIFYGGVNVYLQQRSAIFRAIPRFLCKWLDSRFILNRVSRFSGSVDPKQLGELTVSVLEGRHGPQRVELKKLIDYLKTLSPSIIHLPNLPFIGIADELKRTLKVPIVCTLSGEDIFLDQLAEPYRQRCFDQIQDQCANIDAFVAVSDYYAKHAAKHFSLPVERVHVVPMGITVDDFHDAIEHKTAKANTPFTIGYLARICPEKGLANLADALIELRKSQRDCQVIAAGYISQSERPYLEAIKEKLRTAGVSEHFRYLGEVTLRQKSDFLRSLNALSVPTDYPEAKGLYVLEAMASGVPVVQPSHGSFPELINATGGGILYDPASQDANPLANAIVSLMDDPQLCRTLAADGRAAVRASFNEDIMATKTWEIYELLCK
jgi:glycosyltransferase involved in cell wall biosynthesis